MNELENERRIIEALTRTLQDRLQVLNNLLIKYKEKGYVIDAEDVGR